MFNKKLNKLQKSSEDTKQLIDKVQEFLFSIGIRTSKERAWYIFQQVFKMPYEVLLEKNQKIEYQGAGRNLTHKEHGNQILTINDVGRFELKGISNKQGVKAVVKFTPSKEVLDYVENNVKVVERNE